MKRPADHPAQILMFADVVADGTGGYRLRPCRPTQEITTREAAAMLSFSPRSMSLVIETPLGQKHLRWRWLTDRKGKRVWDRQSVLEYREATRGVQ